MKFTKEKTNIAKGVAIVLMFIHHLFYFHERLLNGNYYIPLIPDFDTEFYVGNFGGICVSMFIFMSGYGMFLGCARSNQAPFRYTLGKLKDFYLTYWTYFFIFVPIGLIFFKQVTIWDSDEIRYSVEQNCLLTDFIGWSARYNGEWWFVHMFVSLLLLLCPFYIRLASRNSLLLFSISISLFLISWLLKIDYTGIYGFLFWQISFTVGLLCAKLNFFANPLIRHLEGFSRIQQVSLCALSILFCFILRLKFGAKIDFLLITIFIYSSITIIDALQLSKIFAYLGKYSFPMWLVHSFFCYYYFQDIIYFPKWAPLIFILLTSASLLSAILIEYVRLYVLNKFRWKT